MSSAARGMRVSTLVVALAPPSWALPSWALPSRGVLPVLGVEQGAVFLRVGGGHGQRILVVGFWRVFGRWRLLGSHHWGV